MQQHFSSAPPPARNASRPSVARLALIAVVASVPAGLFVSQGLAATITFDRPTFEANVGLFVNESFETTPIGPRNTASSLSFPLFTVADTAGQNRLGVESTATLSSTPSDGVRALVYDPPTGGSSVRFTFNAPPVDGFGVTFIDVEGMTVNYTLADNTTGTAAVSKPDNAKQFFGVYSDGGPELTSVTFTTTGGDAFLFDEVLVTVVPSPAAAGAGLAMMGGLLVARRRSPSAG